MFSMDQAEDMVSERGKEERSVRKRIPNFLFFNFNLQNFLVTEDKSAKIAIAPVY